MLDHLVYIFSSLLILQEYKMGNLFTQSLIFLIECNLYLGTQSYLFCEKINPIYLVRNSSLSIWLETQLYIPGKELDPVQLDRLGWVGAVVSDHDVSQRVLLLSKYIQSDRLLTKTKIYIYNLNYTEIIFFYIKITMYYICRIHSTYTIFINLRQSIFFCNYLILLQ